MGGRGGQKSCSDLEEKDILPVSNSSTNIWNISEDDDPEEDYSDTNYRDLSGCDSS